jgi:membrane-bound ClpP family serine protease
MNLPPNKGRRLAFIINGAIDALIGAILLLIGFGILPVDLAKFGLAPIHVNVIGAVMFLLGAFTFTYNLSRYEE